MTQEAASYRGEVEQLRRRFEEYRSTHAVRSRLPDQLWAAAAKLVKEDGIESTARALDVDRPSLQKWTERFDPGAQGKPHKTPRQRQAGKRDQATPAFVEILGRSLRARLCAVAQGRVVWWKWKRRGVRSYGWS